jgi:arginine/ornithine N-succinyltransferase beta subunit
VSKVWRKADIQELIAIAETTGQSRAELPDDDAAKRFRFAIYSYRKRNACGEALAITLDGPAVLVTKTEYPSVTIIPPGAPE